MESSSTAMFSANPATLLRSFALSFSFSLISLHNETGGWMFSTKCVSVTHLYSDESFTAVSIGAGLC